MYIFNHRINALNKVSRNAKVSANNQAQKSIIDYSNPETGEITSRLRVSFEGVRREAEQKLIQRFVKRELHHNYPLLEEKIRQKLFPTSCNSPKILGIV